MTVLDWVVLAGYASLVIFLGSWAGRKEKNTADFFLAGRTMGWAPVAVSYLATTLSALTFIGVPGAAFGGNFVYLQLWFGTFIGAWLVAAIFLPVFYRLQVTTVYEFLGHRFGPVTRIAGASFFIVSRILASAVRLAGCGIAVAVFFDLSLPVAIVGITLTALAYTVTGGIKAVIWTDALQFVLFMVGAGLSIVMIWHALPGGFGQFLEIGAEAGKFQAYDFSGGLGNPSNFWAGNLFALVLGLAVGAADQDIAQRLLTCKTPREAQWGAVIAGASTAITTLLFLTVGASLFVFYQVTPDAGVTALIEANQNDRVFPYYIVNELPAGVRGLLVAALFAAAMSSLDSALNGLASTAYTDLLPARFKTGEQAGVMLSRVFVVGFGAILAAVAMIFGGVPSILWFGLMIMGYTYGALLGIFLLAVLTRRRGGEAMNVVAMVTSVILIVFLTGELGSGFLTDTRAALLSPLGTDKIAWPWAITIGAGWTFALAAAWPTKARSEAPPHEP